MSLRQALKRSPAGLASTSRVTSIRAISSTSPRKAGSSHDDHHSSTGPDDTVTQEGWTSPAWRNTFILIALGTLIFPYLPERNFTPASAYLSPENHRKIQDDPTTPYLTRLIAKSMPSAEYVREKTNRHLEGTAEVAETKLLFQDVPMSKFRGVRYDPSLETGSPFGVPVGSQVDMSDLKYR